MTFTPMPEPPDLMRRHVATPHRAELRFGSVSVKLETNSEQLLDLLRRCSNEEAPASRDSVLCKLIKDSESGAAVKAPQSLRTSELSVVTCGEAVVIAADRRVREVLGFIGEQVTPDVVQNLVIPILCELFAEFAADTSAVGV